MPPIRRSEPFLAHILGHVLRSFSCRLSCLLSSVRLSLISLKSRFRRRASLRLMLRPSKPSAHPRPSNCSTTESGGSLPSEQRLPTLRTPTAFGQTDRTRGHISFQGELLFVSTRSLWTRPA